MSVFILISFLGLIGWFLIGAFLGYALVSYLKNIKAKEPVVFVPDFNCSGYEFDEQMMKHINDYRETKNLNIIKMEVIHGWSAIERTKTCIRLGELSHNFMFRDMAILMNQGVENFAENLAVGFHDSRSCVNAWKKSEPHNENLLDPKWKYMGCYSTEDEEIGKLYCVVFGTD